MQRKKNARTPNEKKERRDAGENANEKIITKITKRLMGVNGLRKVVKGGKFTRLDFVQQSQICDPAVQEYKDESLFPLCCGRNSLSDQC